MYIYKITNLINHKIYIGRTTRTVEQRYREHCTAALKGDSRHLYCSMREYGIENFQVETIDVAESIEELSQKEAYWVAYYHTYDEGYNMTLAGESNPMECSKSRLQHDLRMRDPSVRSKISISLRQYKSNNPVSRETRAKLAAAARGNQKGLGKKRPISAIQVTAEKNQKAVYCEDLHGNIVGEFCSVTEAAKWWFEYRGKDTQSYLPLRDRIKRNAASGQYYSKGLKWFYKGKSVETIERVSES